jgi:hypothetical protein
MGIYSVRAGGFGIVEDISHAFILRSRHELYAPLC